MAVRDLGRALLLAALLAAFWSPASAVRPIQPNAPDFPRNSAWINSVPFTLKDLRGRRVVLVTFINTSTINSVRTFRQLNRWWDQYSMHGLMIIGVHASEFDFDRDPVKVRGSLERTGIRFPVLVDGGRRLWKEYQNEGWPAHYLIDPKGRIIHDHLGEGGYEEFEREILLALDGLNGYQPPPSYIVPKDPLRQECGAVTPPIYLGGRHAKALSEAHGRKVTAVLASRSGEMSQSGSWQLEPDAMRYAGGENSEFSAQVSLIYQGAEALAVAGRSGTRPVRLYVKQDNLWLHSGNAGVDVKWDKGDRSYVLVDAPRLYYVIKNKKEGVHELVFLPAEKGLGLYSFEFSDRCQTDYDHR